MGHTLLVPRQHVEDIWALDAEFAVPLARATLKIASAVKQVTNLEGLNIIQSNGAAATQTVSHLHVHIVPRWRGDGIGNFWPPTTSYSEAEKNGVWEELLRVCTEEEAT